MCIVINHIINGLQLEYKYKIPLKMSIKAECIEIKGKFC